MKYAILNSSDNLILRVSDTIVSSPTERTYVKTITDEQAQIINVIPKVLYFLIDDELKTLKQKIDIDIAKRISERKIGPYELLAQGCTVGGVTYGISQQDQIMWVSALTVLENFVKLNPINADIITIQSIMGPVLDITGAPVPDMTVTQFRQLMATIASKVLEIRLQSIQS